MRCFIAAWPDEPSRERTAALSRRLATSHAASRPVSPANIHLTLAFIGLLDDTRAADLAAACRRLDASELDWQLDTLVHFSRSAVLAASGPKQPRLLAAATAARALLAESSIDYDRKPFVPHVTLLRKVARFGGPRVVDPPIPWTVDHIALYRSTSTPGGSAYERVA